MAVRTQKSLNQDESIVVYNYQNRCKIFLHFLLQLFEIKESKRGSEENAKNK